MNRLQFKNALTLEAAAARKGCSVATIWRRARSGELQLHRMLGRVVVDTHDVDKLVVPAHRGRRSPRQTPVTEQMNSQ